MQTNVHSPQEIFTLPQHLIVPLYQRPYVWREEEQWAPLWEDIRRLTELHMNGGSPTARHFMGAIVMQQQFLPMAQVQTWAVVDGQQRLTTLQLLMDAAGAVLEDHSLVALASRLEMLTHNASNFELPDEQQLKLQHSNKDRSPFQEVMLAPAPVDHGLLKASGSRIVDAHQFFGARVEDWITEAGAESVAIRSNHLVNTLMSGLQLVVITLQQEENSQEIFETLNARGTPLTAADLIKNLVFQRIAQEGGDDAAAYHSYWRLFETPFWEKEISVGRYSMPRSSIFLTQWLGSRVGEEISPRSAFSRFKHFVEHETPMTTSELVEALHRQAVTYESWTRAAQSKTPNLNPVELFVYRMQAAGLEVAKPILIWMTDPSHTVAESEANRVVAALESWLMRRMLLRLPTADLGRVVADILKDLNSTGGSSPGDTVTEYLASLDRASTYWPGDSDVRASLRTMPAYKSYTRSRLRMVLEAIEDHHRGFTGGGISKTGTRVDRNQMHIEHLIPQRWRSHWPVEDLAAEVERDKHVHRLGNLTLLTSSLNSAVSNGPWFGNKGKLRALDAHDSLLMSRRVRLEGAEGWDETQIEHRTGEMIDAILATWPVPSGHSGHVEGLEQQESAAFSMQDLLASGLVTPGTTLHNNREGHTDRTATILIDGRIRLEGKDYDTPSGAGRAVLGHGVNGWWFWRLPDERRLRELRQQLADLRANA